VAQYPNWFQVAAVHYFNKHLKPYQSKPLKCLQLGAYTGDATEWLFENVLTHPDSTLIDVDTWEGSNEQLHKDMNWTSIEDIYTTRHQGRLDSGKLKKFKGTTDNFFQTPEGSQQFDFIYVDADHEAASVLKDGLNSLYRLNSGGILAFDDYTWKSGKELWADPKPAIDAILNCYPHKVVVLDIGAQVWLRIDNPLTK
jgi:predicted O-methyltransferase YrrM